MQAALTENKSTKYLSKEFATAPLCFTNAQMNTLLEPCLSHAGIGSDVHLRFETCIDHHLWVGALNSTDNYLLVNQYVTVFYIVTF
jgi:hypothetical protein